MKYVSKRILQKGWVVEINLQEVRMNLHQEKKFRKAEEWTNEFRRQQWTWSGDILVLSAPIFLFLTETNLSQDTKKFSVIILVNIIEMKEEWKSKESLVIAKN